MTLLRRAFLGSHIRCSRLESNLAQRSHELNCLLFVFCTSALQEVPSEWEALIDFCLFSKWSLSAFTNLMRAPSKSDDPHRLVPFGSNSDRKLFQIIALFIEVSSNRKIRFSNKKRSSSLLKWFTIKLDYHVKLTGIQRGHQCVIRSKPSNRKSPPKNSTWLFRWTQRAFWVLAKVPSRLAGRPNCKMPFRNINKYKSLLKTN